jgi:hypothetical protein
MGYGHDYKAALKDFTEAFGAMEACNRALTYEPEMLNELIAVFHRNYANLPEIMQQQKCLSYDVYDLLENEQQWFLKAIDYHSDTE